MALFKKISSKEEELKKQIQENKENFCNSRDIVLTLCAFSAASKVIVENTPDASNFANTLPAVTFFIAIGFLIPTAINLWKLDTAKEQLKEMTTSHTDKARQAQKKPIKKRYDRHLQPSSIR